MQNLIINADDFGLSLEVNEGIKRAIETGVVNSVSLMVNLPYFDDALNYLKRHPEISVGLHFNITEGRPLLPAAQVGSLLREDDHFFYWPSLVGRLLLRRARLGEIEQEFHTQYQKLKSTGLKIAHFDSHHHLHLFPPIFKFVTQLADAEGISSLRCHHLNNWSLTAGIGKRPTFKQVFLVFLLWFDSFLYDHNHLRGVEGLYDLNWDKDLNAEDLILVLDNLPQGTTELICHLGVLSPSGNPRFLEPRFQKLNLLTQMNICEKILQGKTVPFQRGQPGPPIPLAAPTESVGSAGINRPQAEPDLFR